MNEHADRSVYPLRVEGELDGHLSRWLWLVKWLLVIPHVIVLVFCGSLHRAVVGRPPRDPVHRPLPARDLRLQRRRAALELARGVLLLQRAGTDRYPPFTLADVPDYPARLDVEYPQALSRGLALVKWWLLALPHYLVVAVFAGGAWAGVNAASDGWAWTSGAGLIGLLV